eukprot:gnl/MRDRNA2_/MRDRNA2_84638_c0_seq1.p1 gnl/MRDRNA2_/MRDRNA2_84638_c0~~gnl/MRDRNA2_/MRDRNA2_84638_c0_seq1.p1  ORF type:complete len:153 (+),score=25.94 gnl/MRDRNA2_/MRDRNA2_84638_c0_seq1:197-655(+)
MLRDYNGAILFVVVEVSRGARWLQMDTLMLRQGYVKVAVLGRDAVFTRYAEMQSRLLAPPWPLLSNGGTWLPSGWESFHQEIVDEETKAEQIQERKAFYRVLRRIGLHRTERIWKNYSLEQIRVAAWELIQEKRKGLGATFTNTASVDRFHG